HGCIEERADRIHPGISMCDHHAFRTRSSAAGVIDRKQIGLLNLRSCKFSRTGGDHCFIVEPALSFSRETDEVFNLRKLFANTIDRSYIIAVRTDHPRTTLIDDETEIIPREPISQRS